MNRLKSVLIRFFAGRYGTDNFGRFLIAVYFVCSVLNVFLKSRILQILTLIIAIFSLWRMFSRNHYKRSNENRKFMSIWKPVKTEFKLFFDKIKYSKDSRFRKCKHCKAILKLPNKKGKHSVRCPKCGKLFDVKI